MKKIIGGIAVAAIALTMALNMNFSTKNNNLSNISLANVEALAQGEGYVDCYCMSWNTSEWCMLFWSDGDYWWVPNAYKYGNCN